MGSQELADFRVQLFGGAYPRQVGTHFKDAYQLPVIKNINTTISTKNITASALA